MSPLLTHTETFVTDPVKSQEDNGIGFSSSFIGFCSNSLDQVMQCFGNVLCIPTSPPKANGKVNNPSVAMSSLKPAWTLSRVECALWEKVKQLVTAENQAGSQW